MTANSEKFTGRAGDYAAYRERYDAAIVLPFLHEACGLQPAWTLADVGAGTGMLSDVFLANGNRVIAVEPNAEMRETGASLHQDQPRLTFLDGSAEATGIADASVEMVAVGRALHWFNMEAAMKEFRRILQPEGWLAIIACGRAGDGREENLAYEEIFQLYRTGAAARREGYNVYEHLETFFAPGTFHHAEIDGEMRMTWDMLRGMSASMSFVPLPPDSRAESFARSLREFFERFQVEGEITFATRYWMNAGRISTTKAQD